MHPLPATIWWRKSEFGMGSLCQFYRPPDIGRISGGLAHAIESMHPFGQVMVILPILIPFQTLIRRLIWLALIQLLSNAKTTYCWMLFTLLRIEATDPALSWVVTSVFAEEVMYLINELQGKIQMGFVIGLAVEFKIVADCERIRPEIASGMSPGWRQSGQAGKLRHDFSSKLGCRSIAHRSPHLKF